MAAALLVSAAGLATAPAAWAQPSAPEARAFVQKMGDTVVGVLQNRSISQTERLDTYRTLLNSNFDITTIGRFVVGRYWNTATEAQREEYLRLFKEMIVEVYADRFNQYSGEKFTVTNAQPVGERDVLVTSQIVQPSGPAVNVDWRVRERTNGLQIIDVLVENVSMSQTQRQEFASVIENNNGRFDALLDAIRRRVARANTR